LIIYTDSLDGLIPENMEGFFDGWPHPPDFGTALKLLKSSDEVILAIDDESDRLAGFITAITDRTLSAYIPFLEVLPEYRSRGIGQQLTRRMLDKFQDYYMVDLMCDEELQPFYIRFGMKRARGMSIRNYERQSGC